jgi:hypothetical protein
MKRKEREGEREARKEMGWQIDPFGASSVTPTLNKLAGFDAHLIDRIPDKVMKRDRSKKGVGAN